MSDVKVTVTITDSDGSQVKRTVRGVVTLPDLMDHDIRRLADKATIGAVAARESTRPTPTREDRP